MVLRLLAKNKSYNSALSMTIVYGANWVAADNTKFYRRRKNKKNRHCSFCTNEYEWRVEGLWCYMTQKDNQDYLFCEECGIYIEGDI